MGRRRWLFKLNRKHLLYILPLLWLLAAVSAFIYAPDIDRFVREEGQEEAPDDYPSSMVDPLIDEDGGFTGSEVIVVYDEPGGFTAEQLEQIEDRLVELETSPGNLPLHDTLIPFDGEDEEDRLYADDEGVLLAVLQLDMPASDYELIRDELEEKVSVTGVNHYETGEPVINEDVIVTTEEGLETSTYITVALVFLVLLTVFRSFLAPFVPLIILASVYLFSIAVVSSLIGAFNFPVSNFTQIFVLAVVFGVGTDYCLLILKRFQEELKSGDSSYDAMLRTMKGSRATVFYSAFTGFIGFAAIGLAEFDLYQSASAVAISLVVMVGAIWLMMPAVLSLTGKHLFWPSKVEKQETDNAFWGKLGLFALNKTGFSLLVIIVLLLPLLLVYDDDRSFDSVDEIQGDYDSVTGYERINEVFGEGEIFASTLIIEAPNPSWDEPERIAHLEFLTKNLERIEGVDTVRGLHRPQGELEDEFTVPYTADSLAGGLDEAEEGLLEIADGLDEAVTEIEASEEEIDEAEQGLTELIQGTDEAIAGASDIEEGISETEAGLREIQTEVGAASEEISNYEEDVRAAENEVNEELENARQAQREAEAAVTEIEKQIDSFLADIDEAFADLSERTEDLERQIEELPVSAAEIEEATGIAVKDELPDIPEPDIDPAAEVEAAAAEALPEDPLPDVALPDPSPYFNTVYAELDQAAAQAGALETGIGEAADALGEIEAGAAELQTGLSEIRSGLVEFEAGLEEVRSAAAELTDGLTEAKEGVEETAEGLTDIEDVLTEIASQQEHPLEGFFIPEQALEEEGFAEAFNTYATPESKQFTFIDVLLDADPYSREAMGILDEVEEVTLFSFRETPMEDSAMAIDGVTSVNRDLRDVSNQDFMTTAAVMLTGIFLALTVLLRSLVMPVYVLISLVATYFGAAAVTEIIFTDIMGYPGIMWPVPFFGFVLLMALGVDYSIFLLGRFSELYDPKDPDSARATIHLAMKRIGGTVLSAALILGGTFASMLPSGVLSLMQISTLTITGLFFYTVVLLPLFVPACMKMFGRYNWWPFHQRNSR
ncbi:MMPL family transporter [Salisediminibacterium halotolerans]|uniref:Drug exporter of the RND superfamily n=1 Tax=Salisediminibacterium halotolerans TaxID=517425 RepID=A0A1H9URX8_9BACI|nr:MMPL family transporter [Salisediminibacterium haloalkalitolerans]SES12108.1 putative drug exporter of the RND superfamily [Salisediminibacterium haloalkalitolerans]